MLCVHFFPVHLTSYVSKFFCLLFSNEVACAAPKTNSFPEQGSYSVCIDLSYTVVVEWGYIKTKTKKCI